MKANELMIGDWVKIKTYGISDKFERTEAYIYVKVAEIGSGLITVEYNNEIKEPYRICENTEIEPIPLTPEILEKNGFVLESYSGGIMSGKWWTRNDFVLHESMNDSVGRNNFKYEYVYQLQHALRLCGITREIIL